MSKINYHKSPIKPIETKRIKNIVGDAYLSNYKQRLKKVDELRRSTEQTMKLSEKAFISQFSDKASNPNVDALCVKINEEICQLDKKYDGWGNIIYSCLMSCDDEEFAVSSKKLQTIRLSKDITKAQSNKAQNLVLNWKKLLGSLLDAALFCLDFQEYTAIKVIYIFGKVVLTGGSDLVDLTKFDFDEKSAVILHCIAQMSLDNWLDEDEIAEKVINAYSQLPTGDNKPTKNEIKNKISLLANKYHCLEIENGKIRLVEKVLIV